MYVCMHVCSPEMFVIHVYELPIYTANRIASLCMRTIFKSSKSLSFTLATTYIIY